MYGRIDPPPPPHPTHTHTHARTHARTRTHTHTHTHRTPPPLFTAPLQEFLDMREKMEKELSELKETLSKKTKDFEQKVT